jgi:hypothetical protein
MIRSSKVVRPTKKCMFGNRDMLVNVYKDDKEVFVDINIDDYHDSATPLKEHDQYGLIHLTGGQEIPTKLELELKLMVQRML